MTVTVTETDERGQSPGKTTGSGIPDGLVDQLMAAAGERGTELTGPGGFLPELIKAVLERGMQAELSEYLGYDKHAPIGRGSGNSRNGTSKKTVETEIGPIMLDKPRDRAGSFVSRLVPNGQRRLGGLDDMIISLYAGGMTIREHLSPPGRHHRQRAIS